MKPQQAHYLLFMEHEPVELNTAALILLMGKYNKEVD
jgi:hypothetical protein